MEWQGTVLVGERRNRRPKGINMRLELTTFGTPPQEQHAILLPASLYFRTGSRQKLTKNWDAVGIN